jgi:hypothetical protein
MTPKDFQKYLDRDHYCLHCGATEALAPNHRINRGMGGSKSRNTPSNIVVICSMLNGLIESDSRYAKVAAEYGWKLPSWKTAETEPVYDAISGVWYLLDNNFGRKVV